MFVKLLAWSLAYSRCSINIRDPQRENIKEKRAKMKKGKREAFEGKYRLRRKGKRKVDKQKRREQAGARK